MKSWLLLFGMMSCLSLAAKADDTPLPDAVPTKLIVRVGGFLGPSYSVELKDDALIYKYSYGGKISKMISVTPSRKTWSHFISEINAAKLYRWASSYPNHGVNDGTQWFVDLEINGQKITCRGDNNYPTDGREAEPTNSPNPSLPFNRLSKAVSHLMSQTFE